MAIAQALRLYLEEHDIEFDVLRHEPTESSMETAAAAHVPGDRLAKSVLLEDDDGYLMAVVPSTHRVDIGRLGRALGRRLGLATEAEVRELFDDCQPGAIPPLGAVYGIETVMDDSLAGPADVWFESGDHQALIHVSGAQFATIMATSRRVHFSHHV